MRLRILAFLLLAALFAPGRKAEAEPLAGRDPRDDVFYQFMPIAWRDSNSDAQRFGDFGGMTAGLPYLKSLGVTAVWMNPIFGSPAYHGYQHMPANQLNPWFGTEPQFLSFVSAAHAESVKVLIDLVAYVVSQNSVYFTDSYLNSSSIYTDYLAYNNPHAGNSSFVGGSYSTWNGSTVGEIRWNLANATATGLIDSWCQHWMDPNNDGDPSDGIDGWRLDHVVQEEGWGYNLAWWQQWKAALLVKNPSAFTVVEQADWGSHGQDLLSAHDAAFTVPFMFAARSALSSQSAAGLYSEMGSTVASLPAGKTYVAVLGNHDVDRLSSNTGNVAGRNKVAAAILMTQPFPPCIYYGDELGMRGTKGNWGSDANDIPMREPFKWNAVAGPPMSNYFVLNSLAYNNRAGRDNDGRSVQEQTGVASSLLETYRSLIALRHAHVALRRGGYAPVPNTSGAVWAFVRQAETETLLVAINLSSSAQSVSLNLSAFELPGGASNVRNIVTGASLPQLTAANLGAYPLTLPGYGWAILNANVASPPPPPPSPYDGRAIPTDFGSSSLAATQTAATSFGDNVDELDQMYLRPQADGLAVGITGNVEKNGMGLALLFDTVAGGQTTLSTPSFAVPPYGPAAMTGLGMDTGFAPDFLLWSNFFGGTHYLDLYTLANGGGGTHLYLGNAPVNGGGVPLGGGSNANGLRAAYCDSNTAGVTGASAASAATATFGFEALIPWADLGLAVPGSDIRVLAAIVRGDGYLGNQTLPPLGAGATAPGLMPFSLGSVAGSQYVTLSTTLSAPPGQPGASVGVSAAPNPFRGDTSLRFALTRASHVRIVVLDVSGRLVRDLVSSRLEAGPHSLSWDGRDDGGRQLGAGLYFARVESLDGIGVTRIVRVR